MIYIVCIGSNLYNCSSIHCVCTANVVVIRLEGVQTIEELNDVYSHFLLYYANDLVTIRNKAKELLKQQHNQPQDLEVTVEEGEPKEKKMMKHAKRRDFYTICQENGLGAMVAKFGLKPEQFGDNLRDGYQKHETEQHPVEPEECAAELVQSSGLVIDGACMCVCLCARECVCVRS